MQIMKLLLGNITFANNWHAMLWCDTFLTQNSVPYQAASLEFEMPASSPTDGIYERLLLYHQFRTCKKNEFNEVKDQI
jgi:hypothetical protein